MNFSGDIPKSHLKLIEGLKSHEKWLNENLDKTPVLVYSQCMVCLAYDYIDIDMEEKGEELLLRANKLCPGYFKGPIYSHMKTSPDFNHLMELFVKHTIGLQLLNSLGFTNEQRL